MIEIEIKDGQIYKTNKYPNIDLNELYDLYVVSGLSARECAKALNSSKSSIVKFIKKLGWSRDKNQYKDEYGRFIKDGQVLPPNKGENNGKWNGGVASTTYRRIAFEHYPNECHHCKAKENLQVHHIDKNRKNNNVENLRIVCSYCHMHIEHPENLVIKNRDEFGRIKKLGDDVNVNFS